MREKMNLKIGISWLDELLPEGIPVPSSSLISGPGGTGKPLVEFAFVAAWLKSGGSLIAIPLQYPTPELMQTAMKKLYNVDFNDYPDKVVFIQFDPGVDRYRKLGKNTLQANMIKPDVWDEALQAAEKMLPKNERGIMVFGSALNLLLFSHRYEGAILDKLKESIGSDTSKTYAFAVSTSAFADRIKLLEDAADNLMFTRVEPPMRLFFRIVRMKGVPFSEKEVEVPISQKMLEEIRQVAEETRKRRIPEIRNV